MRAYGGSWFDPASGALVVGLATADAAVGEVVGATGARVVRVERSLAALDAAKGHSTPDRHRRTSPDGGSTRAPAGSW